MKCRSFVKTEGETFLPGSFSASKNNEIIRGITTPKIFF